MLYHIWSRIFCILLVVYYSSALNSVWQWTCMDKFCEKSQITKETENEALSLPVCRLLCSEYAALWPKPTGNFTTGNNRTVDIINIYDIKFDGYEQNTPSTKLFKGAIKVFDDEIFTLFDEPPSDFGKSLRVHINVDNSSISRLTMQTNENYTLNITTLDDTVYVYITASNFFGARHALTTLSQLIVLDDLRLQIVMLSNVYISDGPAYPYRGLLLDTGRSYIHVNVIKNIIKAMGASKLNVFHWHITDSQSFPFVSKSYPELSKYGAYSPKKVYTPKMIKEIIDYAIVRGVRVLPEMDSPGHIGEGWQNTGFAICMELDYSTHYQDYCFEPPCGQLDPTLDGVYPMVADIMGDLFDTFELDKDIFFFGGDEVSTECWRSKESIVEWMKNNSYDTTQADGYTELWSYYLNKAAEHLYKKIGEEFPLIIWQSALTRPQFLHYISSDRFVIQVWRNFKVLIDALLDKGFNIIINNFDAMYLDCGFGAVNTAGPSYCPYNTWKVIYENTPKLIVGERKNQVLGSEVAFWTEQGGGEAAESRIWPRAAAAAEVVWSDPEGVAWAKAEQRFLVHRERLVQYGIQAEAVEMEYCLRNENLCREKKNITVS